MSSEVWFGWVCHFVCSFCKSCTTVAWSLCFLLVLTSWILWGEGQKVFSWSLPRKHVLLHLREHWLSVQSSIFLLTHKTAVLQLTSLLCHFPVFLCLLDLWLDCYSRASSVNPNVADCCSLLGWLTDDWLHRLVTEYCSDIIVCWQI